MTSFADLTATPIPELHLPAHWKAAPLVDCGEPLVSLTALHPARIRLSPQYFAQGIHGAVQQVYARADVATRLAAAAASLPQPYELLIWDAWRPLAVQRALFDAQYALVRQQSPDASDAEVRQRTETYVSFPSADSERPSPHYTGGAVDLTLTRSDGATVPMGTEFDAFDLRARTRSLEQRVERHESLTAEEDHWLRNRRALYHAMIAAGFTNYWEEWWHFDYGNQFWASITAQRAIYGGIEPGPERG